MSDLQKPRQSRSQATLERIYAATVSLLEQQSFEAITVADMVERASTSVGAFYKRFPRKGALLPALLDWIQRKNQQAVADFVRTEDWHGIGLEQRVEAFTQALMASYTQHHLMKTLVARQYSEQNQQSAELVESSRWIVATYADWLLQCRDEIGHPAPEVAVALGLTALVQQMQTHLLFGASAVDIDQATFTQELQRALLAYLELSDNAHARPTSDSLLAMVACPAAFHGCNGLALKVSAKRENNRSATAKITQLTIKWQLIQATAGVNQPVTPETSVEQVLHHHA
jgi:AcrR family transcriptional regulator